MTRRIGYVGLDHHHRDPYLASIEQLPSAVTAAAAPGSVDPADVDALGDVPLYDDYVDLLDSADVDLAWITLSNLDTPDVIEAAVERGIDVYTEKPAARTAADLEPVADAARDADATVGVSYTWRGHPLAEYLRELTRDGFFGDVRGFDLRFVASALDARDTDHYLFDEAASRGGIVQWLGVHWIDLLPWIIDDPIARVNAQAASTHPGVDVEDFATIQFETASGATGTHLTAYSLREGRYDTTIEIYGEDGRSSWDPMGEVFGFDDETTLELDSQREEWASTPHRRITHEYTPAPGYGGRWGLDFFEAFFAACDGNGDPPADLDDAVTVLRVLDAIYESADREAWVDVAGVDSSA